jgi:hypothetical protein
MSRLVSIVEPSGEIYRELLAFAERTESLFSLVWRDQLDFATGAYAVDRDLASELVSSTSTDSWPGTRLLGHEATVNLYKMSPSAVKVLAAPGRLFKWRAPEYPEDLAFYTGPGCPWLGSIAHERDAFLYADQIDVSTLLNAVTGLALGAPKP